jgi:hypothetical protein
MADEKLLMVMMAVTDMEKAISAGSGLSSQEEVLR